jgi:hypothetical protein
MWEYRARPIRVVDGDSAVLELDLGCSVRTEQEVRLLGVSAPERRETGGPECTRFVQDWISRLPALTWPLMVATVPNTATEPTERRSFIRYLAIVWDLSGGVGQRTLNADLAAFLAEHPEWGTGM